MKNGGVVVVAEAAGEFPDADLRGRAAESLAFEEDDGVIFED